MAEGFCRAMHPGLFEAYSAGTSPHGINPLAVRAMAEVDIDISGHTSDDVSMFLGDKSPARIEHVVTVCSNAHESCPIFPGDAKTTHVGFDDPPKLARDAGASTDDEAMPHYRRVRDEIRAAIAALPETIGV